MALAIEELLGLLVDRWKDFESVRPGVEAAAIGAFEQRFDVRMTEELSEYFTTVDGMGEGCGDLDLFRFLPLDEVVPVGEDFGQTAVGHFVFLDYMISSHEYAINLGNGPERGAVVYVLDELVPGWPSLAHFLRAYLDRQAF